MDKKNEVICILREDFDKTFGLYDREIKDKFGEISCKAYSGGSYLGVLLNNYNCLSKLFYYEVKFIK